MDTDILINGWIGEYMDVICPQYDVDETNIMTFVIYNVTKDVFDTCGKIHFAVLNFSTQTHEPITI